MDKIGIVMHTLVSIIMPAYNAEKYIAEAIDSVLQQSFSAWELIIIDDCSSDATKNIIVTYQNNDKRIKPIYLSKNGGRPSIAKNFGLKKAIGKYIAFLDSDDIWMPEKLAKQVEAMQQNSNCGLCYTGGFWIDKQGNQIKSFLPRYRSGNLLYKMLERYELNNQSVLITKQALMSTLGGFNEAIIIGEDYNLFMHIMNTYKTCSIQEHLIKYRIHSNAITKKTRRVSDGVLVTIKELKLFQKFPFYAILTYLKAIRFKYITKTWK